MTWTSELICKLIEKIERALAGMMWQGGAGGGARAVRQRSHQGGQSPHARSQFLVIPIASNRAFNKAF